MGGLAVLFLLGLYLVLTIVAIIKAKPLWAKGLILLAALLIPTADAIYGRIKLNQMCEAEGGLRIYKQPRNIEGYMTSNEHVDDYLVKNGVFKFSESEEHSGVCTRVSMQNGQLIYEKDVKPISKYKTYLGNSVHLDSSYWYQDSVVETYPQNEVVARDRLYLFKGGWAERFLGGFSDAGADWVKCNKNIMLPQELIITITKGVSN